MLLFFFMLFLLVQFITADFKLRSGRPFLYRYAKPILIYALVLVPVLFYNFIAPVRPATPDELIEVGKANGYTYTVLGNYEKKMKARPWDIALYLKYVDYYRAEANRDCIHLMDEIEYANQRTELIVSCYIEIKCSNQLSPQRLQDLRDVDSLAPFRNLMLGDYYEVQGDSSCINYWEAERKINPRYATTYDLIAFYYMDTDPDHFTKLLSDSRFRSKVNPDVRHYFSYRTKNWLQYAFSIIDSRIRSANWVAVIAAFLITLVWLAYVWKIDSFNPEKWWDVAIVFVLSCLATFLCLPLYDYAHLSLQFYLDGNAIHDFFYSFLVIGASEELVKFVPWIAYGFLMRKFKEPYDYLLYASIAALGFAFVENWMYLENYRSITVRSLMAIVAHMFDACIIAYAFILARFRYADKPWRHLLPVAGFILAALSHGFYDFWLISPAVNNLHFITLIFFILSLHVWFFFKNNAINHSAYYNPAKQINIAFIRDLMVFSILGILMMQYVLIAEKFGTSTANGNIFYRSNIVAGFLFYFNYQVGQLKVERGIWSRFRIKLPPLLRNPISLRDDKVETPDLTGRILTFYTSKSNRYLGSQLPISGYLMQKRTVQGDDDWYLVELVRALTNPNCLPRHVFVRCKVAGETLETDKVEVLFMLIPSEHLLHVPTIHTSELRYTGTVFSRPKL